MSVFVAGPDEAVALRSCVPSLEPRHAQRPETREYSGNQSGPGEAGRLRTGPDLQLPHGPHSCGTNPTLPAAYWLLYTVLDGFNLNVLFGELETVSGPPDQLALFLSPWYSSDFPNSLRITFKHDVELMFQGSTREKDIFIEHNVFEGKKLVDLAHTEV